MNKKSYNKPLTLVLLCLLVIAMSFTAIVSGMLSIEKVSAAGDDYNYYKFDYKNGDELWAAAIEKNIEICEEGFTLLKNDNGFLPLQPEAGQQKIKTSMFGNHSQSLIYCGYGSSDTFKGTASVYDSFADSVFELNPTLMNFYANDGVGTTSGHDSIDPYRVGLPIRETPVSRYTEEVKNSYKDYNDLAIVFLSRTAGEGSDLPQVSLNSGFTARDDANKLDGARYWNDHYLQLNKDEVDMIQMVMENFDDIIVVMNASSYIELGFLNDPTHYLYTDNSFTETPEEAEEMMHKFKAAVNVGMPGTDGIKVLPRILSGEVNPSAHLTDTWVREMENDPTFQNFGLSGMTTEELRYGEYYVHYDEDIYMGYRYYETAYAEIAAGNYIPTGYAEADGYTDPKARADAWYEDSVMFPFGHGMSYTTFDWELLTDNTGNEVLDKDGTVEVRVRVTNTGEVAGKDVVQLYYNAPYTKGGISKAHVALGGFAKTDMLEPGESQEITLELRVGNMASYDWSDANGNGFKGYEVEGGVYNIIPARDAHEAAQLPEEMTLTYNVPEGGYTYEEDIDTGAKVENRFDYVSGTGKTNDPETFKGVRQYMSRDDFEGTFPTHASTKHSGMLQGKQKFEMSEAADREQPWYVEDMPEYAATPGNSETNEVKLWHLKGRDYNDPLWDELLDQLSISEMAEMIGNGFRGPTPISSIDMVPVWNTDGPLGRRETYDIQWASNPIVAATWNTKLAYEQGVMFGNTVFTGPNGRGGTYGVGLDIHRSPFGGRYFEYYSEDGLLSGLMGAPVVAGCNTKGCYQVVKHMMLNDQETERNTVQTWASEQAIREIYGKGFEYAVKFGGTLGIMTGVNSIGDIPCSLNYALMTELVRGEWGFEGFIITDMYCEDTNISMRAGIDTMMAYPNSAPPATNESALTATHVAAMRKSVKNVLYTLANSTGINGVGGEPLDRINYVGADTLYAVQNVDNAISVDTAVIATDSSADIKYALREGSELPDGMTLNPDGTISGAPTETGTFTFSVLAQEDTDAYYPYKDKSKTFRMTIYPGGNIPDNIIYEDINLGTIPYGYSYSQSIDGAVVFDDNGKIINDIEYNLAEGSELPSGLTLENGIISGRATAAPGTYFFTIEASYPGKQSALLDFIVKVRAYSISYSPSDLEDLTVGKAAEFSVADATSEDGVQIKYALKEGSTLPEGLMLQSTGVITGTPTRAYNNHTFTVLASGEFAATQESTYTITVRGVVLEDVTFDNLIIGKNYSFKLNASANNGSESPIYFEVKEGSSLPSGFSLLADGTLIGAGTTWGTQTFTVVAKSEGNETMEATVTMSFHTVFETEPDPEPVPPEDPGDDGCGSVLGVSSIVCVSIVAAAALAFVTFRFIKNKKEK